MLMFETFVTTRSVWHDMLKVIVRLIPGEVPKAAGTPKEMGHSFVPLFSFVDFAAT